MYTTAEKMNKSILIAQIGKGNYINTNYAVLQEKISSADTHQYKIDNLAAPVEISRDFLLLLS